jgi:precorrin-6A/cobalt-precorrin-6A reductase
MLPLRVLILGGAGEAAELGRRLAGDARFAPVLSFAGRTRAPALPPIPYRIGGFGGVDGLVQWMSEHQTNALVCATHPFAEQMRRHAVEAARRSGRPLLMLERPAWEPAADDRWIEVADMAAAARALGDTPRRVLLTIGQKDLAPFRTAPQHSYVIRSIERPSAESLPPHAELIGARGPFTEADERALLQAHRIEALVTKNSGGAATAAKLAAARDLGVGVVMVQRPPAPNVTGIHVDIAVDAAGALAWLVTRHDEVSRRRGV